MYNLEKSLSWGVTEAPVICNACRRSRLILLARTLVNTRPPDVHRIGGERSRKSPVRGPSGGSFASKGRWEGSVGALRQDDQVGVNV